RWQLWRCGSRPDLLGFGMGYLWLALGSLATGLAFVGQRPAVSALHLITVGGLGTLSTSVMLRLYFQRGFKTPPVTGWVLWTVGLIAVAVVCRFMAGDTPLARPVLLSLSAGSWAAAYLSLAVLLVRLGWRLK
ncbi:MAG: NnrS family protein, partial [Pseudomonadaceae bacterium]|nr:NnrS family protein [Pseudomonadaceae bacterium]